MTVDLRTKDKDKAAIATSKVGAETELIDRVPESKADLLTQEALKIIDTEARNAFLVHNDSYFQVDLNERRIEQNKDISIKYHPKALSSADIANGIEAAGMFAYGSKVYRKTMLVDGRATKWQDWRDSRLAFFYGDLVKRKGQWSISIQNGALREHVFAPRVSDLPTLD